MAGAPEYMNHVIWSRLLQGWFVIRGLRGLATINLTTVKSQVSNSTHYKSMKDDKNVERGVVW